MVGWAERSEAQLVGAAAIGPMRCWASLRSAQPTTLWSLSHILFHAENGRYAEGCERLIAEGGTLANFERLIGPADRIEYEWYR